MCGIFRVCVVLVVGVRGGGEEKGRVGVGVLERGRDFREVGGVWDMIRGEEDILRFVGCVWGISES